MYRLFQIQNRQEKDVLENSETLSLPELLSKNSQAETLLRQTIQLVGKAVE